MEISSFEQQLRFGTEGAPSQISDGSCGLVVPDCTGRELRGRLRRQGQTGKSVFALALSGEMGEGDILFWCVTRDVIKRFCLPGPMLTSRRASWG